MIKQRNSIIIKLLLILISSMTFTLSLNSINYVCGSGNNVSDAINQQRNRDIYYHDGIDEQHWYGTNLWAVRFDFASLYPTNYTAQFKINKVKVYFPLISEPTYNATVKLCSNSHNQPDTLTNVVTVTSNVTSNLMEFAVSPGVIKDTVWVLIYLPTDENGPYMSASSGNGSHSYYKNHNATTPYFQNMLSAGVRSEFLVNVTGEFIMTGSDFELNSFALKPDISVNQNVRPEFLIINNSPVDSLKSGYIDLLLESPNPEFAISDTIYINRTIPPNSEYFVAYNDSDYEQYEYTLPSFSTQIKMVAVLHSQDNQPEPLTNNTITYYHQCFDNNRPMELIEDFVQSQAQLSNSMLNAQHSLVTNHEKTLLYYPSAEDLLYNVGSVTRFNEYGFMGLPMTVIGGDGIINGYLSATYNSGFTTLQSLHSDKGTFLQQRSVTMSLPSPYTILKIDLKLKNPSTYIYSSPSLIAQSNFYAALCKKDELLSNERYIFKKWAAYKDTISAVLEYGASSVKQISVSIPDIPLDLLNADYVIIYWLQHQTSKEILFSNIIPLNTVVPNTDETIPSVPLEISLSPNPVKTGKSISLDFPEYYNKRTIKYSIFNSKGQLVKSATLFTGKNSVETDDIKATGIYIIKVTFSEKSGAHSSTSITKKILIY